MAISLRLCWQVRLASEYTPKIAISTHTSVISDNNRSSILSELKASLP